MVGSGFPQIETKQGKEKRAVSFTTLTLRSDRPSRAQYSLSVIHTNPEAVEEGTQGLYQEVGACGCHVEAATHPGWQNWWSNC